MSLSVVFTPEAEDQLIELYRYIVAAKSAEVAARYTEAIIDYCEELGAFPHRGSARDDIRPGLRTIGFRRRGRYRIRCVEPDPGDRRHFLRRARLRGGSERPRWRFGVASRPRPNTGPALVRHITRHVPGAEAAA